MDFVREELLRQQAVLEQLMVGGAREETTPETEEKVLPGFETGSGEMENPSGLRASEIGGGEMERLRRIQMTEAGEGRRGFRRKSREGKLSVWERGRLVEEVSSLPERGRERVSISETVRSSVREVSRTIQRDARRYDGGFTIY